MVRGGQSHSSPSLTHFSNITEDPTKYGIQCGKWVLLPTFVRRSRVQPLPLTFEPTTSSSKRKRHPASPANSFTGENTVQVISTIWSILDTTICLGIWLRIENNDITGTKGWG